LPALGGARSSAGSSNLGGASHASGGITSATGGTQGVLGGTLGNPTGGGATGGNASSTTGDGQGTGGSSLTTGGSTSGGFSATGGTRAFGGSRTALGGGSATGGASAAGGTLVTGGSKATGGSATTSGGMNSTAGTSATNGNYPFPQDIRSTHCTYPRNASASDVVAAYADWKAAVVTSDGAGGYLRVKKPDSGTVIGSTVSEGIGYGMLLAVYMDDPMVFDNLWLYEQSHLDSNGLMNWEIGPDNKITSGGSGAASDGDEDMAFALVMADRQWGTSTRLEQSYLEHAKTLIDLIWQYEVDPTRGYMLKPGDQWGNVDVTNPSYFAPAYYRVFGEVTGKVEDWNKVVDSSYSIIAKSLNAASGNQDNGLVPAWCNSSGTPVEAYSGAPLYFQNDSTRTPFRVGQDYCYFGESRAKDYLAKISSFYAGVGVTKITNGYNLNGTPHPEKDYGALQAASFVGPAAVGAMSDAQYQQFIDDAYAGVATLKLSAGTIYYQKSWTALSLLMLTGNFVVLGAN
jgi:endo-1,4-beta-D-glucanase Y